MDNEFVALSAQMQEVKKLISLVRGISVHTVVMGEAGVGKSLVAKMILPNGITVSGDKPEETLKALKNFDEIIIENFDSLPNTDLHIPENKKIVATSKKRIKESTLDRIFGIKIDIPPLSQRLADVDALKEFFIEKAKKELSINSPATGESVPTDVSQNCHSLKKAAYQTLLCKEVTADALCSIMEEYFYDNMGESEENYKKFLDLFDSAIINANHRRYKSQLMMSYKMGINRNTLRKKIMQLGKKLDGE